MWTKGHITPLWKEEYKKFNYIHKEAHPNDIIFWKRQGYNFDTYTGKMFAEQNKMPQWVKTVSDQIGLTQCGYTFYQMSTGIIMPKHVDHFENYCKFYNANKNDVYRAIVALEDWQSGHYFEIDNQIIHDYKRGDYILWSSDVAHSAANLGINTRYTLQITGQIL